MAVHAACDGKVTDVLARHRAGRNFANFPTHRQASSLPSTASMSFHERKLRKLLGRLKEAKRQGRHKMEDTSGSTPQEAIDKMAAYLGTVPPKNFWHTHTPVGTQHHGTGFASVNFFSPSNQMWLCFLTSGDSSMMFRLKHLRQTNFPKKKVKGLIRQCAPVT